jgi:hypothetical protein
MADYVAAHITIGGRVPRHIVPELCEVICQQGVSLDWGEFDFCPKTALDLHRGCRKISGRKMLRLHSDEAPYGNLDLLQAFLASRELPFDRWHESKYEIPCELMVYRPCSELRFFATDLEGAIVVRSEPLAGLARMLQDAQKLFRSRGKAATLEVIRRCQRLVTQHLPQPIPPLPAFTIVAS